MPTKRQLSKLRESDFEYFKTNVKINNMEDTIITKQLKQKIKIDKELFFAYQSNIAMAFIDAERWYCEKHNKTSRQLNKEDKHTIANDAAKHFLDLLIK